MRKCCSGLYVYLPMFFRLPCFHKCACFSHHVIDRVAKSNQSGKSPYQRETAVKKTRNKGRLFAYFSKSKAPFDLSRRRQSAPEGRSCVTKALRLSLVSLPLFHSKARGSCMRFEPPTFYGWLIFESDESCKAPCLWVTELDGVR